MFEVISDILKSVENSIGYENHISPTFLYNEGWMLRLVLQWFKAHEDIDYKFSFLPGAHWYSEGLLSSPFLAQWKGDNLAESYTHADAVVGDFTIGNNGAGDVKLKDNCRQFTVIEAKMYSLFSRGTKNAPDYNQAARTLACMCNVLIEAKQTVNNIGFYVFLPQSQIDNEKSFREMINIENVKQVVLNRVNQYNIIGRDDFAGKKAWYDNDFLPFCSNIKTGMLSWEELISFIQSQDINYGNELQSFYDLSKKYNAFGRAS